MKRRSAIFIGAFVIGAPALATPVLLECVTDNPATVRGRTYQIIFDDASRTVPRYDRKPVNAQQVAYELVRSGLLHSVVSVDGRQRGRRVTLQAIDEFRCRYVALTDLARSRGVGVRRMLGDLSARPIFGPRINGARQYFYRRSDIENSEDQT